MAACWRFASLAALAIFAHRHARAASRAWFCRPAGRLYRAHLFGRKAANLPSPRCAESRRPTRGQSQRLALRLLMTVAGLGLTILGARMLVSSAVELATAFGVSQTVIGLDRCRHRHIAARTRHLGYRRHPPPYRSRAGQHHRLEYLQHLCHPGRDCAGPANPHPARNHAWSTSGSCSAPRACCSVRLYRTHVVSVGRRRVPGALSGLYGLAGSRESGSHQASGSMNRQSPIRLRNHVDWRLAYCRVAVTAFSTASVRSTSPRK